MGDDLYCSHGEPLVRDPETCLFPSGSLFATSADCPRWSPAPSLSSLLLIVGLLVCCCCFMVAFGVRSFSKKRSSESRRWNSGSEASRSPYHTDEGEDSGSQGSGSDEESYRSEKSSAGRKAVRSVAPSTPQSSHGSQVREEQPLLTQLKPAG